MLSTFAPNRCSLATETQRSRMENRERNPEFRIQNSEELRLALFWILASGFLCHLPSLFATLFPRSLCVSVALWLNRGRDLPRALDSHDLHRVVFLAQVNRHGLAVVASRVDSGRKVAPLRGVPQFVRQLRGRLPGQGRMFLAHIVETGPGDVVLPLRRKAVLHREVLIPQRAAGNCKMIEGEDFGEICPADLVTPDGQSGDDVLRRLGIAVL